MESYQKYEPQKDSNFGTSHKVGKDIYLYVQKNGLFKISNKNLELVKEQRILILKKNHCIYK